MRRLSLTVLFFISVLAASSQRIYFIYFQTESQQPFFIKMDEKLFSSTSSGYLLLSRLKDSTYSFTLGFPGNQFPEQRFSCAINKKDHGFIVKNFGEKGWGLVDMQTQAVQMAVSDEKKDVSVTNTPVNAFTDLLSKAADDPTLKQKIVLPEEKKPEVVAQAPVVKEVKKDSAANNTTMSKTGTVAQANKADESLKKEAKKDSVISTVPTNTGTIAKVNTPDESLKKEEKKDAALVKTGVSKTGLPTQADTSGQSLKKEIKKDSAVVAANTSNTNPAARVNTPVESAKKETGKPIDTANKIAQVKKEEITSRPSEVKTDKADQKESKVQNATNSESQPAVFAKSKVVRSSGVSTTEGFDLTFTDTYQDGKQEVIKIMIPEDNKTPLSNEPAKEATEKKTESQTVSAAPVMPDKSAAVASKNNCRQIASDADFYKLRKKMASDKSDASMLDDANKVFRTKCFTSSQIKNLSSLFLGDGGKYSFFDAAYPHIADLENFPALQSELKDEYFVNRFKAMLR